MIAQHLLISWLCSLCFLISNKEILYSFHFLLSFLCLRPLFSLNSVSGTKLSLTLSGFSFTSTLSFISKAADVPPSWLMLKLSTNHIRLNLLAMESMCVDLFSTATSKTLDVPNKAHILLGVIAKLIKEVLSILTSV